MKKVLFIALALVSIASLALTSCPGGSSKTKIGLSFSDFATERWPREKDEMKANLEAKGYEVMFNEANHDAKLQNDQIANMVTNGCKVILVVAEDGASAATAADAAAAKGVKIIAYDRLIKSDKIAAYVSFDNVAVGVAQAEGVTAVKAEGKFVLLGGSPTDNNAVLFRSGQMKVLQPLIDAGKITVVADQWVENWDPANAKKLMENILTANPTFDAVVASNDGTALGALEAMKAKGLAGKVPISGQDATADGCNSIARGELTVTILKDTRDLGPLACDLADKLVKGEAAGLEMFTLEELTLDKTLSGSVPCKFLKVVKVTAANLFDAVVKSKFQSYEDVYKDIPNPPAKP